MSTTENFDDEQFLHDIQGEAPSSDFVVAPEGEFAMTIKQGSTKIVSGVSEKGNKWRRYTARAVIDDAKVKEITNLEAPSARVQFFLDLNSEGKLAVGTNRNVKLGQLLKATGNDHEGYKFSDIEGVQFIGSVRHTPDKKDSTKVYVDVVNFTKLS